MIVLTRENDKSFVTVPRTRVSSPFLHGAPCIDTSTKKTTITMLGGTASLATMAAMVHALGENYHWSFVVFVRISLTFILAISAARVMGIRPIVFGPKALWSRSVFGTVAIICNFYALTHLTVTDAFTILKTSPIWLSIIVAVLNRRMHSSAMWLAIAIGFSGVVVMEQPKFEGNAFPIAVAVFSAIFIAIAQVSMGYLKQVPTLNIVIHFSGFASITTLLVFLIGQHTPTLESLQWEQSRWLLAMAGVGTIGQVWITSAFRSGNPMLMALVGLSSIPLAATYDYVFWGNLLGPVQASGVGLIVIAIVLCTRETTRDRRANVTNARTHDQIPSNKPIDLD